MLKPIAIIGIGCRFPGADNPAALWKLLNGQESAIGIAPADRFRHLRKDGAPAGAALGGYLKQVDQFDPAFFGISEDEARAMDPQQRLMLEVVWETLEDAGIPAEKMAGTATGVYVGLSSLNYGSIAHTWAQNSDKYTNAGSSGAVVANRVSYFLDLKGPSFSVDSACASSLLAVHLACQSIWSGESTQAIAGGVNVILLDSPTHALATTGMLSIDGTCRIFDAAAAGWPRGEGAGAVLLKPLDAAQADGDPVYAVIRSTAVAQNGRSNGISGPNRWGQEAVLREALRRAEIQPNQVGYIEAHSTGTLFGDATELTAVDAVIAADRSKDRPCAIGSVKPHLGHMEATAGIAGLIKTALMLKHRQLVPTLHYSKPNPHAPAGMALRVPTQPEPWSTDNGPIIAGVSATGFGGANVHTVLSQADDAAAPATIGTPRVELVLRLSARDPVALRALATSFAELLSREPDQVAAICHTAAIGRMPFAHRVAVVGADAAALGDGLARFINGSASDNVLVGEAKRAKSKAAATPEETLSASELARRFVMGEPLATSRKAARRVHGLPTYPFQRSSYWLSVETPTKPKEPVSSAQPVSEKKPPACAHVPPQNEIERKLVRIWEKVLHTQPISTQAGFFDLGGTSLNALELFSEIEKQFPAVPPLASLLSASTIEQLAKLMEPGDTAPTWDPVVTLNAAGRLPALFFVPGLGGNAFSLRDIAQRFGPEQPIHVLQPQGLDPMAVPLTRVEDMAKAFLDHIRFKQPTGPYQLAGYSFGGSVAFEMGRQLIKRGETVGMVALLDAYAPGAFPRRPMIRRFGSFIKKIIRQRGLAVTNETGRTWGRFFQAATGANAATANDPSAVQQSIQRVAAANQKAWERYRPGYFPGRVLLFRTDLNPGVGGSGSHQNPTNGWSKLADAVDVVQLPGDHLELFEWKNANTMVAKMRSAMQSECATPRRIAV